MTTYTDTKNPDFKVGLKCFSLAECGKHFQTNWQFWRDELEVTLGLVPQWKKDMQKSGTFVVLNEYNANTEPKAWEITRIRTMPTGYQSITMQRDSNTLTVQSDSFSDAYCVDVQAYIDERMQSTRDKMISTAKAEEERKASEGKAKREADLIKAKALLKRDAELPQFQRDALQKDRCYSASIKAASALINGGAKTFNY